ncbi:intein N-terminal splicing domain protein [Leptospira alstonii serovar Pingchang str. 80-412]|uniref:Intein N-terminal splicing domain protein n=1 Tax=Leptospira alstonii serovar Pingchang str. 80-412 TaxID=1218564 RepID=T0FW55_9LEPT|nr:polymorphic toxin-type HINT domain-containing protein [Leptospira alstonii]EQA78886.1 intein N-terminal splicing domain protein [Leptospira alstonii serovar Pingchang str. 80-412]
MSSNADFIAQYSMNRGMSEDSDSKSKAAQEKNNSEQGAQVLEAAGYAATRREEGDILDHLMSKAEGALGDAWDGVKGMASAAWDGVKGAASAAWDGAKSAFGGSEENLSFCFVAGTLVLTSKGLKPIETVQTGDEVLAFNPETKDQSLKRVVRLFRNENSELLRINFGEYVEVVTTSNHRFFTKNRGFVLAGELTLKDVLFDKSGETVGINSIVKEIHKEKVAVFNFEVEDYHTYYATESCILVHNDSVKLMNEKIAANGELNGNPKNGEEFTINGIKAKISYNANGDAIMNLANGYTLNTQTGGIFKQFEAKGLNSEVIHSLNDPNAPNAKISSVDWKDGSRMHTPNEGKQNGQADLMAKNLTPYSVFDTPDGKFKIKSWGRDDTAGNKAVLQFKDKNGVERETQVGHMANQIPKYVKDHFKMNPDTPLVLKTGTIFGYAGTTGNHYVGQLGKNKSKTGYDYDNFQKYVKNPNPHAHVVFRDAPDQKARPGYDVPSYAEHLGWNPK